MVSTNSVEPSLVPFRRCTQCGAWLMLSCPPATTTSLSPTRMAWYPSATVRSPDPQSWFTP